MVSKVKLESIAKSFLRMKSIHFHPCISQCVQICFGKFMASDLIIEEVYFDTLFGFGYKFEKSVVAMFQACDKDFIAMLDESMIR